MHPWVVALKWCVSFMQEVCLPTQPLESIRWQGDHSSLGISFDNAHLIGTSDSQNQ